MLSIARLYIPLLDKHREQFAHLASKALGKPVVIGKLTASWYHFEPVLQFQNVTTLDPGSAQPLITISQMTIGLDLLKSLWHQRLEPDIFILKGSRLNIKQTVNGQITLNGINIGQAGTESLVNMNPLIAGLFSHGNLVLQDIELKLQLKKQRAKQITMRTVSLTNQGSKHYLRGSIVLEQAQTNPLHFAADITSGEAQVPLKKIKLYLQVKDLALDKLNLNEQSATWQQQGWTVANGKVNAKIWGLWAEGRWQQLQTTLHLQDLMVKHEQQWFNLNELQGNFWLERLGEQWELTADKLLVTMDKKIWQENRLQASLLKQAEHMQLVKLQLRHLDLTRVVPILLRTRLLPANWQTAIQGLQPQGELANFTWQQPAANLTLAASFHNLSFKQWQHVPGVTGLSGNLRLLSDTGQLQIQGVNSQLSLMPLFASPLSLQQWQAKVYLHKNAEGWVVTSPNIMANNQELALHAAMRLFIPSQEASPDIQLLAAIKAPTVKKPAAYYPVGIMHKPLLSWLQSAVIKANDTTGMLVLRGKLDHFPYHKAEGVFNVLAQVNDGELNYHEGWPKINSLQAQLDFTGTGMQVVATKGNIQGSQIHYAKASIANFYAHPNNLQIEGRLSGDASQAIAFLQHSPLQDKLGKHLEPLHWQGDMSTKLSLFIPLAKTVQQDIKLKGEVQLQQAKLAVPMTSTWLEQVTGTFNFSEQGLLDGKLSAMWFDQPQQIDISHKMDFSKLRHTQISLHGLAPIQQLIKFYGRSFWAKVTGQAPFAANLLLSSNTQGHLTQLLTIKTDLKDLFIPLPEPFTKNIGVAKPTHISLTMREDRPAVLSWNYDQQFVGSVKLHKTATGLRLEQGVIALAEHVAKLPIMQAGINVVVRLRQFDWLKWQPWLTELTQYSKTDAESGAVWQVRLYAKKLLALGQTWHHSLISFKPQPKYWTLAIAGDEAHGSVILPQSKTKQPIILDFDKLYLQKNSLQTGASLKIKDMPALVFSCENLHYAGKEFGNVQLTMEPIADGVNLPKFMVSNAMFTLDAHGNWQQLDKQDYTHMQGKLTINHLVHALRLVDIQSVISGNGQAKFNLDWLAKPYAFNLASLQGEVELKLGSGQITSINSSAAAKIGLAKLINILGIESLTRKLSLNFRDLTDKGFNFERMRGNFSLARGNAYTENAYFDGNIAYIGFKGRLGLASKDYDLALKVNPYLTSSIPVIATIAGGPIVGAVSLIADKLIKHEMDKSSGYNYRLSGAWEQPQLVSKKT